jgi:hypothetical protein
LSTNVASNIVLNLLECSLFLSIGHNDTLDTALIKRDGTYRRATVMERPTRGVAQAY